MKSKAETQRNTDMTASTNDDKAIRLDTAKNDDEPTCVEAFACDAASGSGKYVDAVQVRDSNVALDTKYHTDIRVRMMFPDGTHMTCNVDVKAAEKQNLDTGNYSIGRPDAEYISKERSDTFLFAFRIAENGKKTKKFAIIPARAVVSTLDLSGNDDFFLVSLADMIARFGCDIIESDIP